MKIDMKQGLFEIQPEEAVSLVKAAADGVRRPDGTLFGLRDDQALLLAGGTACLALFCWSEYKAKRPNPQVRRTSRKK